MPQDPIMPSLYINSLESLDSVLEPFKDTRPWVMLHHRQICTNCQSEKRSPGILMREEGKGRFSRAGGVPPHGVAVKTHEADAYFAWCEKCNGARPLAEQLLKAIDAVRSDTELAQRAGHILADFFRRRRGQGEVS